jgi:hypothetical protein
MKAVIDAQIKKKEVSSPLHLSGYILLSRIICVLFGKILKYHAHIFHIAL